MPNDSIQKVLAIGIVTFPPAASASNTLRAASALG
jgi:hypothetical protein